MTQTEVVPVVSKMATNPYTDNNPYTHSNGQPRLKGITSRLISGSLRPKLIAISRFLPQHSSRTSDTSSPSPSMSSIKSREIYERRSESPGKRNGHIPWVHHSPSRAQKKIGRVKTLNNINPQHIQSDVKGSENKKVENGKIGRSENNNNVSNVKTVKLTGDANTIHRNGVTHNTIIDNQSFKTKTIDKQDINKHHKETNGIVSHKTSNGKVNRANDINPEPVLTNDGDKNGKPKLNAKSRPSVRNEANLKVLEYGHANGVETVRQNRERTRDVPRYKPRKAAAPVTIMASNYFHKSLAERIIEVRESTGFVPGTSNYTSGLSAPIQPETVNKVERVSKDSPKHEIKIEKVPNGISKEYSNAKSAGANGVVNMDKVTSTTVETLAANKVTNNRVDVSIAGVKDDGDQKRHKPDMTPVDGENTRPIVKRRQRKRILQN